MYMYINKNTCVSIKTKQNKGYTYPRLFHNSAPIWLPSEY